MVYGAVRCASLGQKLQNKGQTLKYSVLLFHLSYSCALRNIPLPHKVVEWGLFFFVRYANITSMSTTGSPHGNEYCNRALIAYSKHGPRLTLNNQAKIKYWLAAYEVNTSCPLWCVRQDLGRGWDLHHWSCTWRCDHAAQVQADKGGKLKAHVPPQLWGSFTEAPNVSLCSFLPTLSTTKIC